MTGWGRFNDQFRETMWETRQRQAERRRTLTAEGKCWQCAKPIAVCDCPNINHSKSPKKKRDAAERERA